MSETKGFQYPPVYPLKTTGVAAVDSHNNHGWRGGLIIEQPINPPPQVDAHSQMLAARVEGLEKELNGFQHVWGRVKALEARNEELSSALRRQGTALAELMTKVEARWPEPSADVTCALLRRALNEVRPVSLLARDISEFLRNR